MYITSVSVICILLIVLIILHKRTNTVFQAIVIWLMLYIISYWCSSSIGISIMGSIILILLLSFVRCNKNVLENFDDEKKPDDDEKKPDDDEKKPDDLLKDIVEKTYNRNIDSKISNQMSPNLGLLDIEKMLKGLEDSKEDSQGKQVSERSVSENSASTAQRESFRLIDTVKELDSTIKSLSPTLTQGKQIIDMMKKLNL